MHLTQGLDIRHGLEKYFNVKVKFSHERDDHERDEILSKKINSSTLPPTVRNAMHDLREIGLAAAHHDGWRRYLKFDYGDNPKDEEVFNFSCRFRKAYKILNNEFYKNQYHLKGLDAIYEHVTRGPPACISPTNADAAGHTTPGSLSYSRSSSMTTPATPVTEDISPQDSPFCDREENVYAPVRTDCRDRRSWNEMEEEEEEQQRRGETP